MTTTLEFDLPVWFQATPLKHRTPKMVCGIFRETFEVTEVDGTDVNAAMSLESGGVINEFFEIDGGFFRAVGFINGDVVKERFKAKNSPVPGVSTEHWEMTRDVREKAKEAGLALFPRIAPEPGDAFPTLRQEWFSDTDVEWLEKRKAIAFEYLSKFKCSGGMLYEPLAEPAFVVNMVTGGDNEPTAITVDFRASSAVPLYHGYPVAYFRADEHNEAVAYAKELAKTHGTRVDRIDNRSIVIHDSTNLSFDPFPWQLLEAASLVMKTARGSAGAMEEIIGTDADAWRQGDIGRIGEGELTVLEHIIRQSLDHGKTIAPAILVETLLERWEERPINPTSSVSRERSIASR